MIKKIVLTSIALVTGVLGVVACTDENQHQFELEYDKSARLTVICHNCFYYSKNWDIPTDTIIVDRKIDGDAIELLSGIKFCGVGDTTPDGWLKIVTDTGDVAGFGIIFPEKEFSQTLRIQSGQTGLGQGCTRRHQEVFEDFFHKYAANAN